MTAYAALFGRTQGAEGYPSAPIATLGFPSAIFCVVPAGAYTGVGVPSDSGAGGTFNPTSLVWSNSAGQRLFTYSPATVGNVQISVTASGLTILDSPFQLLVKNPENYDPLTAVHTWWESQTGLQSLVNCGKLWHLEAPEDAAVEPYATFFLVAMTSRDQTTGFIIWEAQIQFNIHDLIPANAAYIAQQFMGALNSIGSVAPPDIYVQGTQAMSVLPGSFGFEQGDGLGTDGRDCWVAHFAISMPWTN